MSDRRDKLAGDVRDERCTIIAGLVIFALAAAIVAGIIKWALWVFQS